MAERPPSSAMHELDPLIGLTVSGRYRVHTLLGQGGMGRVFQAQQIPLGRSVALKVLEARGVDPEFQRRFFQEAAILAKLQSRHTVTIYDYGRDGDVFFIAMELVAGESLDRVLAASGALPLHRALMIAQHVCRSLREAHAQGVIHRDLKPGNVMITRSEEGDELAKVLDFGLAKRVDRAGHEDTKADTVPGSPKYMAPEVIRQQAIDGRADMYGFGVMFYQMLAGVVPFDRPSPMDILVAHLQETPRPIAQANPRVEIPPHVERVVMRCLAKNPDERFTNMQELLDALRALAMELGLHSEPSWVGRSLAPDPAPSGVRKTPPGLHLEFKDEDDASHSALRRGMSRTARGAWIAGVAGTLALAGVLAYLTQARTETIVTKPLPPIPAAAAPPPSATLPAAAGLELAAEEQTAPDMVITQEETAAPSVKLVVTSDPDGASVVAMGKYLGKTPVSVDFSDARAKQGADLSLSLKLDGYKAMTIKRRITGPELSVDATLIPTHVPQLGAHAAHAQDSEQPTEHAPAERSPILKIVPAEEGADEPTEGEPEEEVTQDEPAEEASGDQAP